MNLCNDIFKTYETNYLKGWGDTIGAKAVIYAESTYTASISGSTLTGMLWCTEPRSNGPHLKLMLRSACSLSSLRPTWSLQNSARKLEQLELS